MACDWWISIRFLSFCVSRFVACVLWPEHDVNIPNTFDRFPPWTSDFQISMRQKYWRFRLNFEIVKVRLSAVCQQSFLSHTPLTFYKTFAWQTFASLRLFTCLVYVSTYCVPIAHLRQNKPFALLYLGHAQIIIQNRRERSRKSRNAWKQFYYLTLNKDKMSLCSIL